MKPQESERINPVFIIPSDHNAPETSGATDFEHAISATKFGKYNILLLLLAIPAGCSPAFATTTMSYVFPVAQCDLDLTLENKGSLNAITFSGMITSGFVWGFLADTVGRRKLLIIGYLLDAVVVILSGLSQSYEMLMVFKFLQGFIINGPFAVFTSYLSEFHAAHYRSRALLVLGFVNCLATLILPLLGWLIFSHPMDLIIFNGLEIHAWNVYLLVCAIPSIISTIGMLFMPESPKFLMTTGHNSEALRIFQRIFELNTGQKKEEYPVKVLVDEIRKGEKGKHATKISKNRSACQAMKEGWLQMRPLCFPPHLYNAILVGVMQTGNVMGNNTLRLWAPQIFTAITNYEQAKGTSSAPLCDVLEYVQPNVTVNDGNVTCYVDATSSVAYINATTVSLVTVAMYIISGFIINKVGKKVLLFSLSALATGTAFGLYYSASRTVTVTLISIFLSAASVCTNLMLAVIVDLFPTYLRTFIIAITMVFGRSGALAGNLIFPLLLKAGCLPPFALSGGLFAVCVLLTLLLPKTHLKSLE